MTLERNTPLKRTPFPRRITPEQRRAWNDEPPIRKSKRSTRAGTIIPAASRKEVRRRSGGKCEIVHDGCLGMGTSMHHRKLRRHGDHRPCNLIHVCAVMHRRIHDDVEVSYGQGWLVRGHDDPEAVPWVLDARHGDNQPPP